MRLWMCWDVPSHVVLILLSPQVNVILRILILFSPAYYDAGRAGCITPDCPGSLCDYLLNVDGRSPIVCALSLLNAYLSPLKCGHPFATLVT
jgi:hypothetical protein